MISVLIVEDNDSDAKILSFVLEKKKYQVFRASEVHGALEIVEKFSIDLLLLDWNLPNISGIDLLKTIRKHPGLKDVPVIVVSGRRDTNDIKSAIESGATDYVVKPIDPLIVDNKIQKWLTREENWVLNKLPFEVRQSSIIQLDLKVSHFSEVGIGVVSPYPLPEGTIINFYLPVFDDLEISFIKAKLYSQEIQGDSYFIKFSMVGVPENILKKIRLYLRTIPDHNILAS